MNIEDIHWHDNFIIHSDSTLQIIGFLRSDYPEILKVVFWNDDNDYYIDINNHYLKNSKTMNEDKFIIYNNIISNHNLKEEFQNRYDYFNEYYKDDINGRELYKNKI